MTDQENPKPARDTAASLAAVFRCGIYVYVFLLILSIYLNTADATIDIKRFLTAWSGVILGGGWLLASWWFGLPWRRPGRAGTLLAVLLALYVVATAASPYFWRSTLATGVFLSQGAIFIVASQVFTHASQVRRLLVVLCGAVALSSVYGYMQYLGYDGVNWDDTTSELFTGLPSTYGNPNFAAHMLILAIAMALALTALGGWPFLVLVAVFAAHLSATGQRGGLVALAAAAGIVGLAWLVGRVVRTPRTGAMTTLVLGGVLGAVALGVALLYLRQTTGSILPLDPSLLIRYQSYASAANMMMDHPVLGHGPDVYALANPYYWTAFEQEWFANNVSMNAHVHNDTLEIGVDAGLLAAGVWIALLLTIVYRSLCVALGGKTREDRVFGFLWVAFFVAFGVDGLFGFNLRVPVTGGIFFLMLGVASTWNSGGETNTKGSARLTGSVKLLRVAAVVILLCVALLESRRFVSQQELASGLRAQARRDLPTALSHFRKGEAMVPWSHRFDQRMTQVFALEGKIEEAKHSADRALAKNPMFFMGRIPAAHNRMLLAQTKMNGSPEEVEEAVTLLAEATDLVNGLLELVPRLATAHELLGQIASSQALLLDLRGGEAGHEKSLPYWEEAERHLESAIAFDSENKADRFRTLAQVRVPQGNYSGAEAAMVEAVLNDPRETETWALFHTFSGSQRRFDRARATLEVQLGRLNALPTPPEDTLATLYLVQANILDNGYHDAGIVLDAYDHAVQHGAHRPEVWTNLARWAFANGRRGNLIEFVKRAYAAHPDGTGLPPQVVLVGQVLTDGANIPSASRAMMALIRGHDMKEGMTVRESYGWAARLLREALLEVPAASVCGAYLDLGIAFNVLNDLAEADSLFRQASRCLDDPGLAVLAIHWGDTLVRLDRPQDAVDLLREAHSRNPENLEVWFAFARGLARLGMVPEARTEYERLLERNDVSGRAREMMENELGDLGGGGA